MDTRETCVASSTSLANVSRRCRRRACVVKCRERFLRRSGIVFSVSRCGMERAPMLTRDELLVLLIEECGEVIQAATKCLRFGYDRDQPGYGVNHEVLAKELGDLTGVMDAMPL